MFMVALDNLVVSTALRTLAGRGPGGVHQQLQWFVNAYVLSFACLLMTGAALGDRFGRRRVFVIGIIVFTLASAGCGLADSSAQLIGCRAVPGLRRRSGDAAVADPALPGRAGAAARPRPGSGRA